MVTGAVPVPLDGVTRTHELLAVAVHETDELAVCVTSRR
jgi:hypothetical protein